ncbi:MAG: TetR/AcrR family transcriptional regulator [Oscillospiraceae bacterium]|nr:TetR/AcrR family transcriptional regulator [Oscillospiraceae bacterium]
MDRRMHKTREAIFKAFTELLSKKSFDKITVSEIIDAADIGRATFYAHFETKDFLLKELCHELFCHIFDSISEERNEHRHIFECQDKSPVFLHLFRHLQKNDNNILKLLSCESNELFLRYFKENLLILVKNQLFLFDTKQTEALPESFLTNHIASTFVETVRWWIANGRKESPEEITKYFLLAVQLD